MQAAAAPNAALLIDFDNVTMGMRSDLSKDLRKLLQSDIIRGKVTVQRAYADWRRYPQYIVPLSENSIDLIFAPAYGSSKKNATDIRMAIDGMELVFTRPEIGTYILLTGDSDFSSLVLKLKEYGKYVIGVGIQESSSDILVQNCDEYYSYTNLAGLTKTRETGQTAQDPWVLVEKAVKRMEERDDVMRSDRLKQVMIELDSSFDEGNFGYSKFSKFLTEAASKGLVQIKKMDNGQYEVATSGGTAAPTGGGGNGRGRRSERSERSGGRDRSDRGGSRGRRTREGRKTEPEPEVAPSAPAASPTRDGGDPLKAAYELMREALDRILEDEGDAVRDSDVKRRMLDIDSSFDEAELGFSKFSRFLRQADDDDVIDLRKRDSGNYEVSFPGGSRAEQPFEKTAPTAETEAAPREEQPRERKERDAPAAEKKTEATPTSGRRLGPRRGSRRGRAGDEPPPIFEGQVVSTSDDEKEKTSSPAEPRSSAAVASPGGGGKLDLVSLGLPTDADAAKRYLANSYKGVGVKTAEALVDTFGDDIFEVLNDQPERVAEVVPANRAETVVDAWREDLSRRRSQGSDPRDAEQGGGDDGGDGGRGGSGGGRSGGRRRTRRTRG